MSIFSYSLPIWRARKFMVLNFCN